MKKCLYTIIFSGMLSSSLALGVPEPEVKKPIEVTFINDTRKTITMRAKFQTRKDQTLYWTDWQEIADKGTIASKNPDDSLFAFEIKNNRIYLLSDFYSQTGTTEQYPALPRDSTIVIREKRIEISAEPEKNIYWIADFKRQG